MQSCTVPCIAMCIASLQSWAQLHYTVPHTSSPHLIQQFLGSRLRSGPIWIRVKLWLSQIRLKIRIIFNGESAAATKFRVSTKLTIAPCLAATQLMSLPEWVALFFYPYVDKYKYKYKINIQNQTHNCKLSGWAPTHIFAHADYLAMSFIFVFWKIHYTK